MKNIFRLKRTSWATFFSLFFFLLCGSPASAQDHASPDTAFISDLVSYYQSRCGNILKGGLFTEYATDTPYIYVFVSGKSRVENALKSSGYFIFCKSDMNKARTADSLYSLKNDCFIYRTQVNVNTKLTAELFSFRKETQAFVVFHELTHVLLSAMQSKLTYTVSESLCEVVGNYLTREYAVATRKLDLRKVDAQILLNEQLYNAVNTAILKIDNNPKQKEQALAQMRRDATRLLAKGDALQKKRFDHEVNNAYLYKNSFFSENYPELKSKWITGRSLPPDLRKIARP